MKSPERTADQPAAWVGEEWARQASDAELLAISRDDAAAERVWQALQQVERDTHAEWIAMNREFD